MLYQKVNHWVRLFGCFILQSIFSAGYCGHNFRSFPGHINHLLLQLRGQRAPNTATCECYRKKEASSSLTVSEKGGECRWKTWLKTWRDSTRQTLINDWETQDLFFFKEPYTALKTSWTMWQMTIWKVLFVMTNPQRITAVHLRLAECFCNFEIIALVYGSKTLLFWFSLTVMISFILRLNGQLFLVEVSETLR